MFSSAKISLKHGSSLGLGRYEPTDAFPDIDSNAPIKALDYARRDRILCYRDAVVAHAYNLVAEKVAELSGIALPRLELEAYPEIRADAGTSILNTSTLNNENYGLVDYVGQHDLPSKALDSDTSLWSRDNILLSMLYQASSDLGLSVFHCDKIINFSAFWPLAHGELNHAEPHRSKLLSTELYNEGDRNLAWRDNLIASHIANLRDVISHYLRYSQRVRWSGLVLPVASDDGRYRTFRYEPMVNSRNRSIVYDRFTNTFVHASDSAETNYSSDELPPLALDVTPYADKARALVQDFHVSSSTTILGSSGKAKRLGGGGFDTDSGVYLTRIGDYSQLAVPAIDNSDLYFLCLPCNVMVLEASLNTSGAGGADGLTLLPASQAYTWDMTVPENATLEVSLTYTASNATTFPIRVSGLVTAVAALVSTAPDSPVVHTFTARTGSAPQPFTLQFLGNSGQVTVKTISYRIVDVDNGATYQLKLSNGSTERRSIFFGTFGEPVVVKFTGVTGSNFTLTLADASDQCALRIDSWQHTRSFEVLPCPKAVISHAGWKNDILRRIVRRLPEKELETEYDPDTGYWTFTPEAYTNWIQSMGVYGQTCGPADIGRPVIAPAGIAWTGSKAVVTEDRYRYRAVLQPALPWMISQNFKTFGPDFWTDLQF